MPPRTGSARAPGLPALAGLVAAGLGLAVAGIVSALLGSRGSPLPVVSESVIDRVPGWLKDWAIATFGSADKTVLLVVVVVLLGAISAAAGIVGGRRRAAGLSLAALLPVVGAVAALTRPAGSPADVLPALVGGGSGVFILNWLLARLEIIDGTAGGAALPAGQAGRATQSAGHRDGSASRRTFLGVIGGTALLALVAGGLSVVLSGKRRTVDAARASVARLLRLPKAVPPAGVDVGVPGVAAWQTPNSEFYRVDTAISVPLVTAADWRLRVHGMVDREIELDFAALLERGLVDRWITLTCVSNEVGGDLVGNAHWTGVPLSPLLMEAGPRAGADAVKSTSVDGFTIGTPLAALTDGRDAMLAVGMNGQPLPVEHGFPVRMVVPGLYGYVSATKWVVDLEVTRFAVFDAYWTSRGWSEDAPIKISSRIEVPRYGARIAAGPVWIAGTAWAQGHGIGQVEVRFDEAGWVRAELGKAPSPDTWRQWRLEWLAEPGTHRLQVRAYTRDGAIQTEHQQGPVPDGASGWHTIEVNVEN